MQIADPSPNVRRTFAAVGEDNYFESCFVAAGSRRRLARNGGAAGCAHCSYEFWTIHNFASQPPGGLDSARR
jgi:hypothetical protein